MTYAAQARALDAVILGVIEGWTRGEGFGEAAFNELALRIFDFQLRYNPPYARFAAEHGITPDARPSGWRAIPALPNSAFKDATIATFDARAAALRFETSGTTSDRPGVHVMESPALYDAALLAGFDRFMLADGVRLRYAMLVPHPRERPASSLGYMMARVAALRARSATWYLHGDHIAIDPLIDDLSAAVAAKAAVCVAGTAFAFVHMIEAFSRRGISLALPVGSRIMETGGFKGRSRVVEREELYRRLSAALGIPGDHIVAEYGMTELTSQYYDAPQTRASARRLKIGPPWLRTIVVDDAGRPVRDGVLGRLVHVDLANRASAIAVATEDLGIVCAEGFELVGRPADAPLRGCSLDAEEVRSGVPDRG